MGAKDSPVALSIAPRGGKPVELVVPLNTCFTPRVRSGKNSACSAGRRNRRRSTWEFHGSAGKA